MTEFGYSEGKMRTSYLDIKSEVEVKDGLVDSEDECEEYGPTYYSSIKRDQAETENKINRFESHEDRLMGLKIKVRSENIKDEPFYANGEDRTGEKNLNNETRGQTNQVENKSIEYAISEDKNLGQAIKSELEIKDEFIESSDEFVSNEHGRMYDTLRTYDQVKIENEMVRGGSDGYRLLGLDQDIKYENDVKDEPLDAENEVHLDENYLSYESEGQYDQRQNSENALKKLLASSAGDGKKFSNKGFIMEETGRQNSRKGDDDKLFKCTECSFVTRHSGWLKRHLLLHKKKTMFRCPECTFTTKYRSRLMTHLFSHADAEPLKCPSCNYECDSKQKLQSHLLTHSNIKLFKCPECSYECNYRNSLKTHILTHSSIKLFQCSECDYACNSKGNLKVHLLKHSDVKEFHCPECDYKCKIKHHLKTHLLTHSEAKLLKCSECDYECNHRNSLQAHALTHSDTKLFNCSECSYETNRKNNLKIHLLTHSSTKLYKCSECRYETNFSNRLKSHLLMHSNVKLFKCSNCEYKTNRKDNLKVHEEKQHSGSKVFECSECCGLECTHKDSPSLTHSDKVYKCSECSYQCNQKGNLKTHLLTHANIRFYKCSKCGYKTNRKYNLKSHFLTHSDIKLFKCPQCDYGTNFNNKLRFHLLKHSDVKLFKCSQCDYGTNRKDYLKNHEQKQHSSSTLKCSECEFVTKSKAKLQTHLLKHFWQSYISMWGAGLYGLNDPRFLRSTTLLADEGLPYAFEDWFGLPRPPSLLQDLICANKRTFGSSMMDASPRADSPSSTNSVSQDYSATLTSLARESSPLVPSASSAAPSVSLTQVDKSFMSSTDDENSAH